MAFEQRDNSLTLFTNDKKEKDTHPDMKGSGLVNGVEFWVSAWHKTSKTGTQYISLSVQPKEAAQAKTAPQASNDDLDDEIPF